MAVKLIYVPNEDRKITPFVDYNYWLKHLDTQINEPTNQNPIKFLKCCYANNKKTLL